VNTVTSHTGISIDRTNWQFGKTDLNLLVLSVAHGDVGIPLFWRVLDKAGNSNATERIDLMQEFKATFLIRRLPR
jgi:hypothetical protein